MLRKCLGGCDEGRADYGVGLALNLHGTEVTNEVTVALKFAEKEKNKSA